MSDYVMKDMSGTSFRNERKESESHADLQGTIVVDGKEYWLNTWAKTSKNGKKFWSHSIRPKGQPTKPVHKTMSDFDDLSDPF